MSEIKEELYFQITDVNLYFSGTSANVKSLGKSLPNKKTKNLYIARCPFLEEEKKGNKD